MDKIIRDKMCTEFLTTFKQHIEDKDDNAAILFLWDRIDIDTQEDNITLLGGGESDGLVILVRILLNELSERDRARLIEQVLSELMDEA